MTNSDLSTTELNASTSPPVRIESVGSEDRNLRLDSIQVLRGVAASLVVLHHFTRETMEYSKEASWIVTSGIGNIGAAGVDLFFVISGFIMAYTATAKCGRNEAADFLLKRALRIYPMYWLWTSAQLILWIAGIAHRSHKYSPSFILSSYALVPALNGTSHQPLLAQGWTLSFEMLFYLVFSCSIVLKLRKLRSAFLITTFGLLFLAGRYISFLPEALRYLWSTPIIFEFIYGALAAEILSRRLQSKEATRNLVPASFLTLVGLLLFARTGNMPLYSPMRFLEWGAPSFLIVMAAALCWARPFNKGLIFIGNASFSIYLTHGFFTLAYAKFLKETPYFHPLPNDLTILIATVATLAITSQAYLYVEVPLQRLLASQYSRFCKSFRTPGAHQ